MSQMWAISAQTCCISCMLPPGFQAVDLVKLFLLTRTASCGDRDQNCVFRKHCLLDPSVRSLPRTVCNIDEDVRPGVFKTNFVCVCKRPSRAEDINAKGGCTVNTSSLTSGSAARFSRSCRKDPAFLLNLRFRLNSWPLLSVVCHKWLTACSRLP